MGRTRNHPKRRKLCVFCNYWIGNANLTFINSSAGYEYDSTARGKCTKKNNTTATYQSCDKYAPSVDASRLL